MVCAGRKLLNALLFFFLLRLLHHPINAETSLKNETEESLKSKIGEVHSRLTAIIAQRAACHPNNWKQWVKQSTEQPYNSDLAQNVLGNEVALLTHVLCHNNMAHFSFGNILGQYFEDLSCAKLTGGHFLASYQMLGFYDALKDFKEMEVFLKALPDVVINANPASKVEASLKASQSCRCLKYCWSDANSSWTWNVPQIVSITRNAFASYFSRYKMPTNISPNNTRFERYRVSTSLSGEAEQLQLPFVPDVAIHYRCGDNLDSKFGYGLLTFPSVAAHIPPHARYVYVLSEGRNRGVIVNQSEAVYFPRCVRVLDMLFDYLEQRFPRTTIVSLTGGHMLHDMARLLYANTTICSASTFCLFPALASESNSFFPAGALVAEALAATGRLPQHFSLVADSRQIGVWPHPWGLVNFSLLETSATPQQLEGKCVKGKKRSIYLVQDGKLREFQNIDAFEKAACGSLDDVWHISDEELGKLSSGENIS